MLSIPSVLRAQFDERLLEKAIPGKTQWSYINMVTLLSGLLPEMRLP